MPLTEWCVCVWFAFVIGSINVLTIYSLATASRMSTMPFVTDEYKYFYKRISIMMAHSYKYYLFIYM